MSRSLQTIWLALLFCLLAPAAFAQTGDLALPALTGRVVDGANVLSLEDRAALTAKLKAYEDKTTDQVVVATVPSLGGTSVEDYANRLFRRWALGDKTKNNGVLLLVAPSDRKVRIEVGYGLEGTLTDAISSVIIRSAVAPRFKAGDYAGGINAGVDAIIGTLTGDTDEWQRRAKVRADEGGGIDPVVAFVVFVIVLIVIMQLMRGGRGRTRYYRSGGPWIAFPSGGSSGGSWSGGGGGFSDSFSGGGGSSGGGGASGSW
jgi:uncharacterized protein